jgi:hypothetical protein
VDGAAGEQRAGSSSRQQDAGAAARAELLEGGADLEAGAAEAGAAEAGASAAEVAAAATSAAAAAEAAEVLAVAAATVATAAAAAAAAEAVAVAADAAAAGAADDYLSEAETVLDARWLANGSADPHGVGDVDRVRPARAPALRLGTRSGATADELRVREFPRANVPPVTPPHAPPPAPEQAPVVTSREQVVPLHSLTRVGRWRRQLSRCFRAAARGNASLARRLRPPDLWLPHEENSVAATAAWNWDLRPLEHGLPAVPLPVSGRDGLEPATGIALREVEALRQAGLAEHGFDDEGIVSEMLSGIEDDSRCIRGTLLCAPHAGALRLMSVARQKLAANVTNGWSSGGHDLPCWPLRSCPYSIVDESVRAGKPKFRLTTDLSWPHPGAMEVDGVSVDAVNWAMERSAWPANRLLKVHEFAEAAAVLQGTRGSHRRVRLWSLDGTAFYREVGRQRAELWRNAVWLPDGAQLDERCCFGDASAATKCARISNFLVWQMRVAMAAVDELYPCVDPEWLEWQASRAAAGVSSGLSWLGMYVDDAMAASADDLLWRLDGCPALGGDGLQLRRAMAHFEAARAVLVRFGWGSEQSKERPPAEVLEALGAELHLVEERLRLSRPKRRRYAVHARAVAAELRCDRRDYMRVLGRLTSAVQCYPIGRQHLHAAWRVARTRFRLADGSVPVTKAVRRDLLWWAAELEREGHEGVPLAAAGEREQSYIYADASGEQGWMAWAVEGDELLYVEGDWSERERRSLIICEKELLASTWGLVALQPFLQLAVVSYTDNTVAQAAMRSMAPGSAAMQELTARRTQFLFEHEVVEQSRRITSKANLWADLGSRRQLAAALQQAEQLGLRTRRVDVPCAWRDTAEMCELAMADHGGPPPARA